MRVFAPTDKRFAIQHLFQNQIINGQSIGFCKFGWDRQISIGFSLRDVEKRHEARQ